MRKRGFLIALMVVAAACGMARPANADLIFQDSFDYAVGSTVNGSNGGTGWAGAWTVGSVTPPAISPIYSFTPQDITAPTSSFATGNQLRIDPNTTNNDDATGGGTPSIRRNINIDTTGDKTYYFSTLLRRNDVFNQNGTENNNYLRFNDNATNPNRLFSVGHNSTEGLLIGIGTTDTVGASGGFVIGTNYLLVGKVELSATDPDRVSFSLLTAGAPVLTEPMAYDLTATGNIGGPLLQLQLGLTRVAGKTSYDEIRFGTDFASVTAVPEPSGLAVASLAGLALIRRMRSKKSKGLKAVEAS
jgi:hypothetical protein